MLSPNLFCLSLSSCVTRNSQKPIVLGFLVTGSSFSGLSREIKLEKEHGNYNAIISFQVQLLHEKGRIQTLAKGAQVKRCELLTHGTGLFIEGFAKV